MLTEREILNEIENCQKMPLTDKKFERLADCYIVYDHLFGHPIKSQSGQNKKTEIIIDVKSDSEFLKTINGKKSEEVWHIINDLVEVIKSTNKKLYNSIIDKLYQL